MNPMRHRVNPLFWDQRARVLGCVGLLWCGQSHAAIDLQLRLETRLGHNSNVYKQSSEPAPVAVPDLPTSPLATGTFATVVEASAGIPLASEQSRLVLATQLEFNRYNSASALNHQASRSLAQLNWRFSPLIQTEVQLGYQRRPYPIDDTYPKLDLVTRQWIHGEIQLRITPDLSVPIALTQGQSRHEDRLTHASLDVNQRQTSLSVRYQSPLGNVAQVGLQNGTRDYPDRPTGLSGGGAEKSKDQEWFASVNWVLSPLTQVNARLATRQTRQSQFDQRDTLYSLSVGHVLSPFWRLDGSWWNQPVTISDPALASARVQGHRFGVTWTPSAKVSATLALQRSQQTDELLNPNSGRVPLNPSQSGPALRATYALDKGWNLFADYASEKISRSNGTSARQSNWLLGVQYSHENVPGASNRNQLTPRTID